MKITGKRISHIEKLYIFAPAFGKGPKEVSIFNITFYKKHESPLQKDHRFRLARNVVFRRLLRRCTV